MAQFSCIYRSFHCFYSLHISWIQLVSFNINYSPTPLQFSCDKHAFLTDSSRLYVLHVVKNSSKWLTNSSSVRASITKSSFRALNVCCKLWNGVGKVERKYAASFLDHVTPLLIWTSPGKLRFRIYHTKLSLLGIASIQNKNLTVRNTRFPWNRYLPLQS